ncbi:hypothetical protein KA005_06790, partial [bacterium]|nr:hypothetical protein [bacterium]
IPVNVDFYIRGRINPDKSTIYIHDLKSRYHHPTVERAWTTHIKNALHKVAMYMNEQITEDRTYDKNPLSAIRKGDSV